MNLSEACKTFQATLNGFDGFWCVAGGWAIDLYLHRQTREHEDLEVVVLRDEAEALYAHFKKFHPQKIFPGEEPRFVQWKGETIESDVIQIRLAPQNGVEFDLLLTPSDSGDWICRRDEGIRRSLESVVCETESGIPVLSPEIVLLFKAKYLRPHDLKDFENVLPSLKSEACKWLSQSLLKVHPGHRWLNALR